MHALVLGALNTHQQQLYTLGIAAAAAAVAAAGAAATAAGGFDSMTE